MIISIITTIIIIGITLIIITSSIVDMVIVIIITVVVVVVVVVFVVVVIRLRYSLRPILDERPMCRSERYTLISQIYDRSYDELLHSTKLWPKPKPI